MSKSELHVARRIARLLALCALTAPVVACRARPASDPVAETRRAADDDLAQRERALAKEVARLERTRGANSRSLIAPLTDLAEARFDLCRLAEAEELLERASALASPQREYPDLAARVLRERARIHLATGARQEALAALAEARSLQSGRDFRVHPERRRVLAAIAELDPGSLSGLEAKQALVQPPREEERVKLVIDRLHVAELLVLGSERVRTGHGEISGAVAGTKIKWAGYGDLATSLRKPPPPAAKVCEIQDWKKRAVAQVVDVLFGCIRDKISVRVRVAVGGNGTLESVLIASSGAVPQCVLDGVAQISFQPPPTGRTVLAVAYRWAEPEAWDFRQSLHPW